MIDKDIRDPSPTGGTDVYGAATIFNQYPNVTFAGQSKQKFKYDGDGSPTSDGNFAYTYDPENRLLSATGSSTTTYANDPRGRRATKVSGGTTTNFLDDGDDEIGEYDGTGALLRRFVPGPAIDDPIAEVTASGTYEYFHSDHHGSVVAMSASSGSLTEGPFLYDSYGNSTCSGAGGVPFRYTGQYLDPETCLYYYRARYYSPAMGRFLQVDPVGYTADMDLYAYVGNDPTDATDPTGLSACSGGASTGSGAPTGSRIAGGDPSIACGSTAPDTPSAKGSSTKPVSRPVRVAAGDEDREEENYDPLARSQYHSARSALALLDPSNKELPSISAPDWTPSSADAARIAGALEDARDEVANEIANGHAFEQHADEMGIGSSVEFALKARETLSDPETQVKNIGSGRATIYYNSSLRATVVVNHGGGESTMFPGSQSYFNQTRD